MVSLLFLVLRGPIQFYIVTGILVFFFSIQEAKEKFQQLQKVISILGDEEKRAVYDQTGSVDDAVSCAL